MKKMMILMAVALWSAQVGAVDLASWNNDGSTGAEDSLTANDYHASLASAPELSRGAGTPFPEGGYKDTFCMSGCDLASLADAVESGRYISWTVNPSAGTPLKLSSVMLRLSAQNSGEKPVSVALLSSATGWTPADAIETWVVGGQGMDSAMNTEHEVSFGSVPALQAVTGPVEFRIYAWGAFSPYPQFGVGKPFDDDGRDDLIIKGAPVPQAH